jgi:hypothetical protein
MSDRSHTTRLRARFLLPMLAAVAAPAAADGRRFDVAASVAVGQSYDDNVFAVPVARRADTISQVTPKLGLTFQSTRLRLGVGISQDAESFRANDELSTGRARREGTLDARWLPGDGFELAARASHTETHSPGEFAVITDFELTGLELRRSLARRTAATGTIAKRLGARTRVVAEHGYTADEVVGGVASVTSTAGAHLERNVGPTDLFTMAYLQRRFSAAGSRSISHAVTLGWTREITPRAHLELVAGPRWSATAVEPELAASLRHTFRRGDATLSFVQTETAVIGEPQPVAARGLSLRLSHSPRRGLRLSAGPSVFEARGRDLEATVYRLGADLAWRLGRQVALEAAQELSVQRGTLDGRPRGEIVHNTVQLRLVAGAID